MIVVQETFYWGDFVAEIRGYNAICKQGYINQRFPGGVAMYIHDTMPFCEIVITTHLQIVAAQVNISG